jgi:Kelch motif/Galactose oxidase, central domain
MPTARQYPAVGAIGARIYVVGGATATGVVGVNEIYNAATNSWTTGAAIPTASWAGVGAIVNGVLYVIGGSDSEGNFLNSVQAYDPVTNSWTTGLAPMPTARNSISVAVVNNLIYVIGGYNGTRLNTVESYDAASNVWAEEAPMLGGRSTAAVGVLGTNLVAVGGLTNLGVITGGNEGYDVEHNLWGELMPSSIPVGCGCAWGIEGQLYAASGGTNAPGSNAVEAYDPKIMDDPRFNTLCRGRSWFGGNRRTPLLPRRHVQWQPVRRSRLQLRADLSAIRPCHTGTPRRRRRAATCADNPQDAPRACRLGPSRQEHRVQTLAACSRAPFLGYGRLPAVIVSSPSTGHRAPRCPLLQESCYRLIALRRP